MKKIIFTYFFVFLLIISCKKNIVTTDELIDQNICTIAMMQGNIKISDNKGNLLDLTVGDRVYENYIIETSQDSFIELTIGDLSIVKIKELSSLKVNQLFIEHSTEKTALELIAGIILIDSEKLSEESAFMITTETITAGIRGTQFTVLNDGENSSIMVKEGEVAVDKNLSSEELEALKKSNPDIAISIENNINKTEYVSADEKITINNNDVIEEKKMMTDNIKIINESLSENNEIDKSQINNFAKHAKIALKEKISETEKKEFLSDYDFTQMRAAKEVAINKNNKKLKFSFINVDTPVDIYKNKLFIAKADDEFEILIHPGRDIVLEFSAYGYEVEQLTIDVDKDTKIKDNYRISFSKKEIENEVLKDLYFNSDEAKDQNEDNEVIDDLYYYKDGVNKETIDDLYYDRKADDESIKDLYYESDGVDKSEIDDLYYD